MAIETPSDGSWADQATDLIVSVVGTIRDKTVGPAMTAARAIVYGFFAAIVGLCAFVLATVFLVRIVTVYVGGRVWIPQLALGVIFGIGALVLWGRAKKVPHR